MRVKESADDYRYFPDPDLPVFEIEPARVERLRGALPETFLAKRARYRGEWGLSEYDARVLTEEPATARFFEAVVAAGLPPKSAANWVQGEILAWLGAKNLGAESLILKPSDVVDVVRMQESGRVSHQAAKLVLRAMLDRQGTPSGGVLIKDPVLAVGFSISADAIVKELDLQQITDSSELARSVDAVVAQEAKIVGDYRGGKETALNALLGRVMRATRGKGDPNLIKELLLQRLGPAGPAK
jgi:aspartyl-tRNA(Asn)/glutamyl-tRNA(Gln) amidotransferase subunit B